MCGIAGRIDPGGGGDPVLLRAMCDAMVHRGPDSAGYLVDGGVMLGMRRLAIIDVAGGDQPRFSEDGSVAVVFNGEIYNHRELRAGLLARGHVLSSDADTEVIAHLWEEHGPDCVTHLRGMFAVAIWDAGRRELLLARDRLGKKPLYWSDAGGILRFGSEPRVVLQDPDVPRDVDPVAIDAFLVNQYVPHDLCAFAALHKLPPASRLHWRPGDGAPVIDRYWHLDYEPKDRLELPEAAERVRELLLEATRLRLMSDVPLGAFLSGGTDSAAVVAAMARTSAEPVRTFSVAFADAEFDETPYARMVAERYGTDHQRLEVGPLDAGLLPRLAWHFGEPFADPAALPTYQLSELARAHVTVALSGDGGDESFAGYRRYWQLARTLPAERVPAPARRAAARALAAVAGGTEGRSALPRAARLAHRLTLSPAARYSDLFRYLTDADRDRLYTDEFRAAVAGRDPLAHVEAAWATRPGSAPVDRLMAVDLDTYLPDDLLPKVDVTSMAHSLEVRAPLLDHVLVEEAARMPVALKLRGTDGKVVLREAVRPWLPDGLLDRPKQGFAVPLERWLREELRDLPELVLLDPRATERGLFRPGAVRALIEEHRDGTDRSAQLWALINLELWFRTCVDRVTATAAELPALL
ncbi:MAG TPA: asparagine synthase (glutamine-hydrolyzing) [Solirubrobacteraceae bacterium]|nr:asparagine synthase (glutamine-hydrolyzing) [Solirubrobacteraceae bacterium]